MRGKPFFFVVLLLVFCVAGGNAKRIVRVLAIGNSFSEDAVEHYLYELAAAQGDSLVIGNAYIPGCPLDRHWDNALTGKKAYRYRKIVGGVTTTQKNTDLATIVRDDEWDVITLQQASHYSGLPYTYSHLVLLKDYVRKICRNGKVEVMWHLTWAYAQNSKHSAFRYYKHDQQQMYSQILLTAALELPKAGIKHVIPTGIAVQEARKKEGDVLCRDGFHLQLQYGRYLAACTWCEVLTKRKVIGNTYHPKTMSAEQAKAMQEYAHIACKEWKRKIQVAAAK